MSLLDSRSAQGKKFIGIMVAVVVILAIYSYFQNQPVDLPHAELQALQDFAPAEHLAGATLEARKTGQGYTVELIHEDPGGRRLVHKYDITSDLTVTYGGLTVGLMGKNPMRILIPFLFAAAFVAYAMFRFGTVLFSKRCPHCRTILSTDQLTLFGGEMDVKGDSLAPIVLTTHACGECGFKRKRVGIPGDYRPSSTNVATLVRPDLMDDWDKKKEKFMQSRTLTYEDWEVMLKDFKEEYEGEFRGEN